MAKNKQLNITEIEDGISKLIKTKDKANFISDFLSFYDIPKASITRAKKQVEDGKDFTIKNKIFYGEVSEDVVVAIDTIEQEISDQKSKPRYIITTDFESFASVDTKTRATLNIQFKELPANADFFLALNGIEKADYQAENPADRKAAERFAKLYDVIAKDNPNADEHAFNLFLIRVLFLLFAEDTGIMKKNIFTDSLKTRTNEDGSDFNKVIKELFEVLDINTINRSGKAEWLLEFPYVNGKLFGEEHVSLNFSKVSRQLLIEAGELLNWQEINPDILGSMIQSVASEEDRHVSGMHYTSVPNIMKLIRPLFLDELNDAFDELKDKYEENEIKEITEKTRKENKRQIEKDLNVLLHRISKIKFLDPACGSGNFLIITYKELRRLEIKIMLFQQEIQTADMMPISGIHLGNFSGIEIDDFAHEVAKLSLWIAEHQMNEEMIEFIPGSLAQLLPLKDAGNIIHGNSLKIDWKKVVSCSIDEEVYLMGNPPYYGHSKQNKEQKNEIRTLFDGVVGSGYLDYITGWFFLGAKYIQNLNGKLAFVSTNSICQGIQVDVFWKQLYELGMDIDFAYQSFKWGNNAKNNAEVTVVIIGLSSSNNKRKIIFYELDKKTVKEISPYLVEGGKITIKEQKKSMSGLPLMIYGNKPSDGGGLILEEEEYQTTVKSFPELTDYFKKYIGSDELINDKIRRVLWMNQEEYEKVKDNIFIKDRMEIVRKARLKTQTKSTNEYAKKPYRFKQIAPFHKDIRNKDRKYYSIIIPRVSSENRIIVPMGIAREDTIVPDSAMVIFDSTLWILGILQSKMHMEWLDSIGGKMETRYRYSSTLVYNTFPIPSLSTQRKNEISRVMLEILELREYEGGSLADLYNKETIPNLLKTKHEELNGIIDRAYQQKPFESDEERLSTLLNLYQEMTAEEK